MRSSLTTAISQSKPSDLPATFQPYVEKVLQGKNQAEQKNFNPEEVLCNYNQAIELDPTASLGYLVRGQFLESQQQFTQAINDYTKYLQLMPTDVQALQSRSLLYKKTQKDALAKQDLELAIKYRSEQKTNEDTFCAVQNAKLKNPDFYKSPVKEWMTNPNSSIAIQFFKTFHLATQLHYRGTIAQQAGQLFQAEYFYIQALILNPYDFFSSLALSEIGRKVNSQIALNYLEQILDSSCYAPLYWSEGHIYVDLQKSNRARRSYESAIELSALQNVPLPRSDNAMRILNLLQPELYEEKEEEETKGSNTTNLRFIREQHYPKTTGRNRKALLVTNPLDPMFYHTDGYIHVKNHDHEKAKLNFNISQWLSGGINQVDILEELAEIYLQQGQVEYAYRCFKNIPISPQHGKAEIYRDYFVLVHTIAKDSLTDDNLELALKLFDEAISLSSLSAELYLDRAITHKRLNNSENAAEDYKKAYSLAPNNPAIQRAYKRYTASLTPLPAEPSRKPHVKPKRHGTYPPPNRNAQFKPKNHKNKEFRKINLDENKNLFQIEENSPISQSLTSPDTGNSSVESNSPLQLLSGTSTPRSKKKKKKRYNRNQAIENALHYTDQHTVLAEVSLTNNNSNEGLPIVNESSLAAASSITFFAPPAVAKLKLDEKKQNNTLVDDAPVILTILKEPMELNDFEKAFVSAIQEKGYKVAIYGGEPRDRLIGSVSSISDIDFITDAPTQVIEEIATALNIRIKPRKQVLGSYKAVLDDGTKIDIISRSGNPFSKESALNGDFTVNTLRLGGDGQLYDYLGCAYSDLMDKVLVTTIPPEDAIVRDPIIILRAIYFVCKLGFTLDAKLHEAIIRKKDELLKLKAGKINYWLRKDFSTHFALKSFSLICELQLLDVLFPFMKNLSQKQIAWLSNEMRESAKLDNPSLVHIYSSFLVAADLEIDPNNNIIQDIINESAILKNALSTSYNLKYLIKAGQTRLMQFSNTNNIQSPALRAQ